MSKGTLNKVILIGNLGADPEVRYMPSGSAVTNLRLATTEAWKDQQGQLQERTEWHRVVLFGRQAETAKEYLRKGQKVYIEGSIRTQKWQDKNTGQDRYSTEIVASDMQMLDRAGGTTAPPDYGSSRDSSSGGYNSGPPGRDAPAQQPGYSGGGTDDFDDDIPF